MPIQVKSRRRTVAQAGIPAVLIALAGCVFVIIGRVSDEVPSLRLALVTLGITGALTLLGSNRNRGNLFTLPETRAVLGLLGLSILTIPFSFWPSQSLTFVTRNYATSVFLFLVIIYRVKSARGVQILLYGLLAAMVFLGISLLLWGEGDRPYVTKTYDPNDMAFIMVCGFPLAAMWSLRGRGPGRYIAALTSALAVIAVLRTGSRGGLIGLCVVLALLLVRASPRQRLGAAVVVLACVLILGALGSNTYWERMATIWSGGGDPTATDYNSSGVWAARWPVWTAALRLMFEHPVIGVGPGAFEVAEGLSHGGAGKWSAAHNSYLQIGTELGLPGLALFVFLLYRAKKNCRMVIRLARQQPQLSAEAWLARGLELSLYGFIVTAFGLSQAYSSLLYVLVAISVVLARLASQHVRALGPRGNKSAGGGVAGSSGQGADAIKHFA